MIKPIYSWFCLLASSALGQTVQNPSFETAQIANSLLPEAWCSDKTNGYLLTLDSTTARTGTRSLRIASTSPKTTGFQIFTQDCSLRLTKPTVIRLRMAIKADPPSLARLGCQTFADQKMIGFMLSQPLLVTQQWSDRDLVLLLPQHINRISVGGSLQGRGQIWFDDVRFEATPYPDMEPSPQVKRYLDKAIQLVRKHSLFRKSIPWLQTQAQLMGFARGMQTEQQGHALVSYLLDVMKSYGDNHSSFQSPNEVKAYHADQPQEEGSKPEGRYLGEGIGYLLIPRMGSASPKREADFATTIQQFIQAIDTAHRVTNWVVDVRQNQGGNTEPMLTGVQPLLGARGHRDNRKLKAHYHLREPRIRVAILLDSETASAGEFTALNLIGLPGVRTFGSHTAGYTTWTYSHKLADGAELYIA